MKKAILAIMICVGACTVLSAQAPPIPDMATVNNADATTVTGDNKQLPLAPATLLLLGLGASVTGYRIYRNTKQNND